MKERKSLVTKESFPRHTYKATESSLIRTFNYLRISQWLFRIDNGGVVVVGALVAFR